MFYKDRRANWSETERKCSQPRQEFQQSPEPSQSRAPRHEPHFLKTRFRCPCTMNDFISMLGEHHTAVHLLSHPVAHQWLTANAPRPARLSTRQRRLAVCVASDGTPAFLSPCFLLNERFALCVNIGPIQPPVHLWWESPSSPPTPARVVVDLVNFVLVESHQLPGSGQVLRALTVEPMASTSFPKSILLAVPTPESENQRATAEIVYKRNCSKCLSHSAVCICVRESTLQSASLPGATTDASIPPLWLHFAERFHASMDGSFLVSAAVLVFSPLVSPPSDVPQPALGTQPLIHSPVLHNIKVTISDPRSATFFFVPALAPPTAPRHLLPRPPAQGGPARG